MEKAKVYFCKEITPEKVVELYKALGKELPGNRSELKGSWINPSWSPNSSCPLSISIIKETTDGNDNYRKEHIFYDSDGNTEKSLSANYEGADIKWFTYYDAKNPENNISIESVYNDGLKTEEKIYNQEYKLMNTLKADYSDGERTELTLFDEEGKEKESIKSDR